MSGADIDATDITEEVWPAEDAEPNDSDEDIEYARPLRLVPDVPAKQAVNKLAKKLRGFGASELAANAIADAVTAPEHVAMLLDNPRIHRVSGADLLVVYAEAYTSRLIADPANPRIGTLLPFPVAVAPGTSDRARYAPVSDSTPAGSLELELEVESLEALAWHLACAMEETAKHNEPRPSIATHGVMDPPLVVATVIRERTSGAEIGQLVVKEGSSRLSHAQRILGISARDALLGQSPVAHRTRINELNAVANSPAASISAADAARVRVATIPVEIVIGVRPDRGIEVSVAEAVAAKVAQEHLNHKKQWDDAAKEVLLGEKVLTALRDAGEIGAEKYDWLAGRLTPEATRAADLPANPDDRWAHLVHIVTARRGRTPGIVRKAIATVLEQEGVGRSAKSVRNSKLPLAVALAMRARRGLDTETAVERFSRVLTNSLPSEAYTVAWAATSSTPEELRDDAIRAAQERRIDAAGLELLVRAVWYLGLNGQVAMPRNDLGVGGDRRQPFELLAEMLQSEHGVRELYQALVDGRGGQKAAAVGPSGDVQVSGVGDPVPLTDTHIRTVVAPKSGPPLPPPRNPLDEFLDAVAAYRRAVNEATSADRTLAEVQNGHGEPVVQQRGLDRDTAADLRSALRELVTNLDEYERFRVHAETRADALGPGADGDE